MAGQTSQAHPLDRVQQRDQGSSFLFPSIGSGTGLLRPLEESRQREGLVREVA